MLTVLPISAFCVSSRRSCLVGSLMILRDTSPSLRFCDCSGNLLPTLQSQTIQEACRGCFEYTVMCAQELKPLVYPVVQLLLGVAGLVPSPRYFPLRLRCIASLSALSAATGVFIPLAPPLLEVLTWSELRKAPAGQQAGKIPDLMTQLRAGQSQLRMPSYQEAVVNLVSPCIACLSCHCHLIK